jgi:preprotein translocase subunit SecD
MTALAILLLLAAPQDSAAQAPAPAAEDRLHGLWIADIAFSPADIAGAAQEWDGETAIPIVILTFTESGLQKFRQAQAGRVGQVLEIRVDGELVASPLLMEIVAENRIAISGSFTREEAAALARRVAPQR